MTPNPSITTVSHDTQPKYYQCHITPNSGITTVPHGTQPKYHHSATWYPTQVSPQCHMTPKYHHSATLYPTHASPYLTPAGRHAATFAHNSVSRSCGDNLGLDVTLQWQWRQRSYVEMAPQQHSTIPHQTPDLPTDTSGRKGRLGCCRTDLSAHSTLLSNRWHSRGTNRSGLACF